MAKKNPLETYLRANRGRQIHKWSNYPDIYHEHLARFRNRKITVVEFGVQFGGSMQMWRHYFGRRALLFGVDIDPRCQRSNGRRTKIFTGDQADREFLRSVVEETGPIDVVIEDGGHFAHQQIATFEVLYPHVKPDGIFLIEDLHTSYWRAWQGGLHKPGTFMEYAKGLTDQLTAWHSKEHTLVVDDFTRSTRSMHFYDSIIVFEKGTLTPPVAIKTGVGTW